jgi:hypothetical protein
MRRITLACALASILSVPAFGQGVDPLLGTWKFNPEKSTGTGLVRSGTLTWTAEGQNLIDTAEGVDGQGQAFKVLFRHIYDGMPHPTTWVNPAYDASTYTRVGNTINVVRFRQGKAVEVGQAVIVPGKTYTLSVEGIDANNQPYRSVGVYDRQ